MPIYSLLSALRHPLVIWTVYLIMEFWTATLLVNLRELGTLAWGVALIISVVVGSAAGFIILPGMRRSDSICNCED